MKNLLFIALFAIVLTGCKKKDSVEARDVDGTEVTASGDKIDLNTDKTTSYVSWLGSKKIGGGKHQGNIYFNDGHFTVSDGNLVGGELSIDMASLHTTDDMPDNMIEKLEGHLKSGDFFEVEVYPTASFKIMEVDKLDTPDENGFTHTVTGTLTLKNTAKVIDVPAKVSVNGNSVSLLSEFGLDRSDFNVKYGSTKFQELTEDKIINDVVDLKINIAS